MEEQILREQSALIDSVEDYIAWEQRCDAYIESLEEQSRIKRPRLSIGNRQSLIAQIARLEGLKNSAWVPDVARNKVDSCGVRLTRCLRAVYRLVP